MFGPFDKLFDFDHDGMPDIFECAAQYQILDELMREESGDSDPAGWDNCFGDADLDYDELEMMDPEERREALEDAGLYTDDLDF